MEKLKEATPDGRFWIKLDATDIKAALQESVDGKWNGDPDIQDGRLETLRAEYEERIREVKATPLNQQQLCNSLEKDKEYLNDNIVHTIGKYQAKFKSERSSTDKLKELNWDIVELVDLMDNNSKFMSVYSGNVTAQVHADLKQDFLTYLKDLFKKKRSPAATHVLVLMLSDERRARKPYCMPVQYVPYYSITADDIQRLTAGVKRKMVELGMKCRGKLYVNV